MKSVITVAAIAIATIVNRSGWVPSRNVDGLDAVTSLAVLTTMRRIVAADSGPATRRESRRRSQITNRMSAVCQPETTPVVDVTSRLHSKSRSWSKRVIACSQELSSGLNLGAP